MRICYLADGRYVHTHRWMRYFSAAGHSVHLISFAPLTMEQLSAVQAAGAVYHGQHENFHLKKFWLTAKSLRFVRRVLSEQQIDLLHCHFLGANAWYGALSRFHPLVITVMGGDVTGPDWRPAPELRERFLTPFALRKADLITCWSHKLTGVVKRYARADVPIEVIHGGVDLNTFVPGPRPQYLLDRWKLPLDARIVFSPRLMRPLYNLDKIALAAREVCAADPKAYFVFAYPSVSTDIEYEASVRSIVVNHGLAERVRFIGGIDHAEMADHYRVADVMVSVPRTDGTPLSVLESMACGTPVVVSQIPDYDPYYIEPDETVLDAAAEDSRELAATIMKLLDDRTVANRISKQALERVVRSAGYISQMSRMQQLYDDVANAYRAAAD